VKNEPRMSPAESWGSATDTEQLEELEPFEELEEIEELGVFPDLQRGVNDLPPDSLLLSDRGTRSVARSYESIPEPLALLDDSLGFIYRNPPFEELIRAFGYPESSSFLTTLAKSIDSETARSIFSSIGRADKGHSWKGTIAHKSKVSAGVITKVHIFPLWLGDEAKGKPVAFSVYMDDVTEENRKFLHDHFSSLLEASKVKDNDTGRHNERVNLYASVLAETIYDDARWPEVDKDFVDNIGFLAAMHDVGKIGTPDDILNKQGPLNEFEWNLMKEHTKNGAYILSSYPNPMAKEVALSHHEWWNGSGYPYNLEGAMIPLSARIVTLADVYDALRMRRSYKPAYPHPMAVHKMRQERGVHFDPELVDVFVKLETTFEKIYLDNAD